MIDGPRLGTDTSPTLHSRGSTGPSLSAAHPGRTPSRPRGPPSRSVRYLTLWTLCVSRTRPLLRYLLLLPLPFPVLLGPCLLPALLSSRFSSQSTRLFDLPCSRFRRSRPVPGGSPPWFHPSSLSVRDSRPRFVLSTLVPFGIRGQRRAPLHRRLGLGWTLFVRDTTLSSTLSFSLF